MLELKTNFGTFGNFKDMARYMEEEGISEVTGEAYFIYSQFNKFYFTLAELREKLAAGDLT